MPKVKGDLGLCTNGYHLCRPQDLIYWLNMEIYEAEYRGEIINGDNKVVVRQVRLVRKIETWNEKTARLFACWCARQIWHLLDDDRSKQAVEIAERFANGEATQDELDAARDAAWAVARDAARYVAWAAARNAAWEAARNAAWNAAREAQSKKLLEMLGETE